MKNKVITILFCLILATGVITHIVVQDKYYSENEKRTLKQFPKVSWDEIRTGKFGDEIEGYLADQFPARDGWVTIKTITEKTFGKKESGGVYFAKDGYLIETHKTLSDQQIKANIEALKHLQANMDKKGVSMHVMLVPTAGTILSDKLPTYAPYADQKAVIEYAKQQGLNIVDVTAALDAHKDEYIFYKTDHHWTSLGSYYAYSEWMKAMGRTADPISAFTKETLCDNFRGTTYSKVNYPFAAYDTIDAYYKTLNHEVDYNEGDYVTDTIYERKFLEGTDQYATFLNSNQSVTVVKGAGSGKCLIVKDSYANCFAQFAVDDFEETHLIDMRFFRGTVKKYIEENGIDEVLVLYNIPNFSSDMAVMMCDR